MNELNSNLDGNPMAIPTIKNLFTVLVSNPLCNLRCKYCSTHKSDFINELELVSGLGNNRMLTDFKEKVDSRILKVVGGGEIFMDNNLIESLLSVSPMYEKIIVVTNGTLITNEKLKKLSKISNLVLCLSLDGHLYDMNQYRFSDVAIFNQVFKTLHDIMENCIDLQINMVLHNKNNDDALSFFDYLLHLKYELTVNMSPLITKDVSREDNLFRTTPSFAFQPWQSNLQHIIEDYDRYSSILLPKVYYEQLLSFINNGFKRQSRCYIPYFEMQLFDSGKITPCPIIWNQDMGHFNKMPADIYREKIYGLLTKDSHFLPFCRHCFSSSDLWNLYMEDKVDTGEIQRIPFYNNMRILQRISEIKNTIRAEIL